MEPTFWQQKWEKNETAFHGSEANPLLVKYFERLGLADNSRVFVPLCGKTLDIAWLLSRGCSVAGAELSSLAVQQLFEELGFEPEVSEAGALSRHSARNIDIFVGDLFALQQELLGAVDAIYDRAALVALPEEMRLRYSAHLMEITAGAPQLLIAMEYDQALTEGPPFSVSPAEVHRYYAEGYDLSLLESRPLPGGFRGIAETLESVWLLK